ncbi:murein biosynthesis integral membrane protein MurJ [Nocardioides campestrisoli]|uniref:murein biosynthesis integral membrane protein MurJ n=1 Tax=Nocardioides campestrisoli TaxID=2736757 RepID=UPI0028110B2C|nr:murein biosynthesis integral membrane protein MurJ [Nocardioides campestrisoli]
MSESPPDVERRSIARNSAVMAAGTLFSRISGYLRSALLVATLGSLLHADLFNVANTIPNALYILLAGGVFNAVLVPQLVRALKHDEDAGAAYTSRIITLAAIFLGAVSLLLVAAAPWIVDLYFDARLDDPAMAAQRDSAIAFARFCLPQVFFYGMFVLVGQVLNARGTFGPMMWAPIANNVISIGMLVTYWFVYGPAEGAEKVGPYSTGQELLLGLGSTAGIVVQLLVLLPYLKAAGFSYRPRFDFRGTGLGHTMKLAIWTILFVVVNQITFWQVTRLATSGTVGGGDGTGPTVYANSMLITMVPHAIITVSLATAILPRLSAYAAEHDLAHLARTLSATMRSSLAIVVPFAALLPVLAPDLANAAYGWGAGAPDVDNYVLPISLFGIGLVFFTVHYFTLRGFYALEQTRTVFLIQCVLAAVNITAAVLLVGQASPRDTVPALVTAYGLAYVVGASVSFSVLRRRVGGLEVARLVRFGARLLLVVALSTAAAWLAALALGGLGEQPHPVVSVGRAGVVGVVDMAVFLVLARVLRLGEVTELVDPVMDTVRRRLRAR